jgi:hypothetical protein
MTPARDPYWTVVGALTVLAVVVGLLVWRFG